MLKGNKISYENHEITNSNIMSTAKFVARVAADTGLSHADVIRVIEVLEQKRRNDIEIDKYNVAVENDYRDNINHAQHAAA